MSECGGDLDHLAAVVSSISWSELHRSLLERLVVNPSKRLLDRLIKVGPI